MTFPGTTLTKYLLKEVFTFFLICLSAFTGILLTIRMLKLTGLVVNKGVGASQVAAVLLAIIPTFLEIALPLSSLLAVMLAFARLSGDSEIIVLKSSGVSFIRLTIPVMIFGLVVSILGLLVSCYLKPWGYNTLATTFYEIARTKTTAGITPGIFNKLGSITLYSEQLKDQTGELIGVLLDDQREENRRKLIVAKNGLILPDPKTETILFLLYDGEIHEYINSKYVVTTFDSNRIVLNPNQLTDTDSIQKGKAARELYPKELQQSIDAYNKLISENLNTKSVIAPSKIPVELQAQLNEPAIELHHLKKKRRRLKAEKSIRLALPFSSLCLALIGLPLGIQQPRQNRTWGSGLSVVMGMVVFIVYYGIFTLGLSLAESGKIYILISTWFANLCCLSLAIWFGYNIALDKWTSVSEGVSSKFRWPTKPSRSKLNEHS